MEAARLCLDEGKTEDGERNIKEAKKLIKETGYHRRDPEVPLEYARLYLVKGEKAKARKSLQKAKKLFEKMGIKMWEWEVRALENTLGEKS